VIPQLARLSGTVRAFSMPVMELMERNMRRTAEQVAASLGATAKLDFRVNFAPTVNNPQQAEFAASICEEIVGAANVERNPPLIMASEDFSFMLERGPGLLHQHRQRRRRGCLRGAQPGLRLQRRGDAAGGELLRARGGEEARAGRDGVAAPAPCSPCAAHATPIP
jgi:hypothetical protein